MTDEPGGPDGSDEITGTAEGAQIYQIETPVPQGEQAIGTYVRDQKKIFAVGPRRMLEALERRIAAAVLSVSYPEENRRALANIQAAAKGELHPRAKAAILEEGIDGLVRQRLLEEADRLKGEIVSTTARFGELLKAFIFAQAKDEPPQNPDTPSAPPEAA